MIISHSKQFCYWKIARTGSNTAELCIRMSGALDLSQDIVTSCHFFPASHNVDPEWGKHLEHRRPDEAIAIGMLTQEQYDAYDHYTIIRNPIDRWVSAYTYHCREHTKEKISPIYFFENFKVKQVMTRQLDYLSLGNVRAFPFSNYEQSIRTMIALIGGVVPIDIPRIRHMTRGMWARRANLVLNGTNTLKADLLDWYGDDLLLEY